MRFVSYEAAHAALTETGFTPTSGSVHVQQPHEARVALRYAHPDGSTVVLAHQLAQRHGGAGPCQEGLGLATVGG